MTDHVHRLSARCCGGRLAVVTEGGYDLTALEACLDSTLAGLAAGPPAASDAITGDTSRAERVIPAVRRALAPYWAEPLDHP
jgi:acetoin utilization deacetylase AcuC-like enzyme